jgi:hypothetical protein
MDKEVKDRMEKIRKFMDKELKGAPFLAVVSYIEETEVTGDQVSHKTRTLRISHPTPGKADFLTFKNLLISTHHDINNYFASLFPPPNVAKSEKESDKHYG